MIEYSKTVLCESVQYSGGLRVLAHWDIDCSEVITSLESEENLRFSTSKVLHL